MSSSSESSTSSAIRGAQVHRDGPTDHERSTPVTTSAPDAAYPPIAVARVVRTRGLGGEVVTNPLTPRLDRFKHIGLLLASPPEGHVIPLRVSDRRIQGSQVVLKFVGIDTIEKAQAIVGCLLCVPHEEAIELEPDEFFQHQLLGCGVETKNGHRLGEVIQILESTGTPVLVIQNREGRECLIPFATSICPEVDIRGHRIVVDPPEGLLEL